MTSDEICEIRERGCISSVGCCPITQLCLQFQTRLHGEWVAGQNRNQWPVCVGASTRLNVFCTFLVFNPDYVVQEPFKDSVKERGGDGESGIQEVRKSLANLICKDRGDHVKVLLTPRYPLEGQRPRCDAKATSMFILISCSYGQNNGGRLSDCQSV